MNEIYSDDYFRIERDDARRVVFVTRTEHRGDAEGLLESMQRALLRTTGAGAKGYGLLIDSRLAVGRNEADFETQSSKIRQSLQDRYSRVAILVGTKVGELQARRMAAGDRNPAIVTTDYDEALRIAMG